MLRFILFCVQLNYEATLYIEESYDFVLFDALRYLFHFAPREVFPSSFPISVLNDELGSNGGTAHDT